MVTVPGLFAYGAIFLLISEATAQSDHQKSAPTTFMGRRVTITEPETDEDGFFPKGPVNRPPL